MYTSYWNFALLALNKSKMWRWAFITIVIDTVDKLVIILSPLLQCRCDVITNKQYLQNSKQYRIKNDEHYEYFTCKIVNPIMLLSYLFKLVILCGLVWHIMRVLVTRAIIYTHLLALVQYGFNINLSLILNYSSSSSYINKKYLQFITNLRSRTIFNKYFIIWHNIALMKFIDFYSNQLSMLMILCEVISLLANILPNEKHYRFSKPRLIVLRVLAIRR